MMRVLKTLIFLIAFSYSGPLWAQPSGFENHIFNGRDPKFQRSEVNFKIMNGDCSARDYGDGRGESNCWNGNVSSRLASRRHIKPGTSVEYSFAFRVEPTFSYPGDRLEIAMWQRINTIKNHMYELELNAWRGATFEGKVCAAPKQLSSWTTFSMKVIWRSDNRGKIEIRCNGKTIYERAGNVLVPEGCGTNRKRQCEPARQQLDRPIQFQIGPLMRGFGGPKLRGSRPSAFERFQDDGITIQVRDLKISKN
jgi:hypothetical protein